MPIVVIQDVFVELVVNPFIVMNTIGLIAFAFVGASKAIEADFDVFGITIVGLAMAFAGGVTRDILVGRVPLALQTFSEISLGLFGVGLAIGLHLVRSSPETHPITVVSDAIGLGAFATAGAIVATEAHISVFGIIAIATINAVGGGAFADILLDRAPFILFEDFYASCAVLGGISYVFAGLLSLPDGTAAGLCAIVTIGIRLAAVSYNWELPTVEELTG